MPSHDVDDEDRARVLQDLLRIVDEHGWAVRQVGAGPTAAEVQFSCTVGLTALGHPEVVALGLPPEVAALFLNMIGDDVRAGRRFEHGAVTAELTDGVSPVVFLRVVDTGRLTAVEEVCGRIDAVQVVWPDSTGRLPWQEGHRNPPTTQPLLGPPPEGEGPADHPGPAAPPGGGRIS